MSRSLKIKVSGQVQGVFYRASTRDKAEALGLCGFVRNEPDGKVYIEVEGDEFALKQFVDWCWQGPMLAQVTNVQIRENKWQGFETFLIRYDE
ncbi:acylphosphatase [Rapidithrix thailandica]|uniref:acylphosphatase n=1 Tax=Rapidithrix thailandica TaxID=413964 RepID=A0AAW9SDR7_9BACT